MRLWCFYLYIRFSFPAFLGCRNESNWQSLWDEKQFLARFPCIPPWSQRTGRHSWSGRNPGCLGCRGARTSTSPRCLSSAARLDNRALTAPCGTCSCSPQVFTIDSRQSWDRSSNSECLPTFPNSPIKMQIGETVAMDPLNAVAYKYIIMIYRI